MTTDQWFALTMFLGIYISCLLLLDGAHRGHMTDLKRSQREQVDGLRSYIRTLTRERKWLEAELAYYKLKAAKADKQERQFDYIVGNPPFGGNGQVSSKPEHIEWLPPSEEYEEEDG
jgi:hypothetical protein